MNQSVKKRIFEPFFTTKEVGTGTGLGLSVSYMIITGSHKGTIEVESVPEQGTKFTISLPLQRKQ
jgi:two-component system NtrC family sensor kinase